MKSLNILFYTTFKVSATKGGVEHTTISVANMLKNKYGCHCFSAYHIGEDTVKEDCFESEYCWRNNWKRNDFQKYCKDNNINCIINQGEFSVIKQMRAISDNLGCKLFFVHHFVPGWETAFFTFRELLYDFKMSGISRKIRIIAKIILFPFLKYYYIYQLPRRYNNAYEYSDRVILLCNNYIPLYQKFGRFRQSDKFLIIPNAVSFKEYLKEERILQKKPLALIVSRLDEKQKRLSLALKVWQEVKKNENSKDWKLIIVGHGGDEKLYKEMIHDLNIPDVKLMGRQHPQRYYEEASVFLMTSCSEGWPLTLLEAQQFGVVPIVFNSFASLKDVVDDGKSGWLVPECDISLYITNLLLLMKDKKLHKQMAINAIHHSMKFSQDIVGEMWWRVLNEL